MKKVFFLLLVSLAFFSCEKKISGPMMEVDVSFSLVNIKGENLLNPAILGSFKEDDIDLFIMRDGSKSILFQGNLDASKFFKIRSNNGKFWLQMYFDANPNNFKDNKITQYIRFKDKTEFEIVGEFNSDRKRNKILQQIWVDGVAKSKSETVNSGQNPIILIK